MVGLLEAAEVAVGLVAVVVGRAAGRAAGLGRGAGGAPDLLFGAEETAPPEEEATGLRPGGGGGGGRAAAAAPLGRKLADCFGGAEEKFWPKKSSDMIDKSFRFLMLDK